MNPMSLSPIFWYLQRSAYHDRLHTIRWSTKTPPCLQLGNAVDLHEVVYSCAAINLCQPCFHGSTIEDGQVGVGG